MFEKEVTLQTCLKKGNVCNLSIYGFSLLFAYLLSFVFEGQVLYSLIDHYNYNSSGYILAAIIAHFIGLFSCGSIVKSPIMARRTMLSSMVICFIVTFPFFFLICQLYGL